jgi:hypothetical protein
MMHFVDVFVFVPESIRSVNEYKILILVVDHLGNIIKVQVLKKGQN